MYDGTKPALARCSDDEVFFDISVENVLYVKTVKLVRSPSTPNDVNGDTNT